jgi:hypothetical protein
MGSRGFESWFVELRGVVCGCRADVRRIGDAVAEDRKRLEETMVVGPGGTVAPRVWSGWRAGREAEERRQKFGEEEVSLRSDLILTCW